jgi:predicted DNA binding CopG/RHH family protein
MKEPRLNELAIDEKATRRICRRMGAAKFVKITINLDADSLDILRTKAAKTGVPYQRLLNRVLAKALRSDAETQSRLSRLEKDIAGLKRKIVA